MLDEQCQSLAPQSRGAGFLTDIDGTILDVSEQLCAAFGVAREAVRGCPLAELVRWDDAADQDRLWRRALVSDHSEVPATLTRSDGEERECLLSSSAIDADGETLFVTAVVDVTEVRRAERARFVAEQHLRAVVELAPIALWAVDRDRRLTLLEGSAIRTTDRRSVVGRRFDELWGRVVVHVQNARSMEASEVLDLVFAGREIHATMGIAGRFLETHYVPLRAEDGSIAGVIGVATDISERRLLQEQLAHAQKMEAVGRLAGGVAHDFNNVLGAIGGFASYVAQRLPPGSPLRAPIGYIEEAVDRAAALTRQLLAFSRKRPVEPRVVETGAQIVALEPMLKRLVSERVELLFRLAPDLPRVKLDATQLEQILMNLVANARDAMPEGGELRIETDCAPDGGVLLRVADNGTGMDDETRARAFEPFFTTKRESGTGLGLSTTHALVTQSGGTITVDSAVGAGTTVTIWLPATDEEPTASTIRPRPSAPRGGGETILVVDDDHHHRAIVVELLRSAGYAVIDAAGPGEALLAVEGAVQIDLVVSDVMMPRLNGPELIKRLRRSMPGLPVVYVTGYEGSAFEFESPPLMKPFSRDALLASVREQLAVSELPARRRLSP